MSEPIATPAGQSPLATRPSPPTPPASPSPTGVALTPTPLPTPTDSPPPPTPAPPEIEDQTDVELGVAWGVPRGWHALAGGPGPEAGVLRRAWANREDAVAVLAGTAPPPPDTLLVLTIRVDDQAAPFPPPGSRQQMTPIGQQVAAQTLDGPDAAPFDLRLRYTIARAPFQYALELGCLFPAAASDAAPATAEATCRDMWDRLSSHTFGLCPLPTAPMAPPDTWQAISDDYYGYAFDVPAAWQRESHPTPDRVSFLSDLTVISQPRACELPNGLMVVRLGASPFGNFLPADGPDLSGYELLPDRVAPTWIRHFDETEVGIEGATVDGLTVTGVHVRGDEYWYTLSFQCYAPSGADDAAQAAFWAQCDAVFGHIFDSFRVRAGD